MYVQKFQVYFPESNSILNFFCAELCRHSHEIRRFYTCRPNPGPPVTAIHRYPPAWRVHVEHDPIFFHDLNRLPRHVAWVGHGISSVKRNAVKAGETNTGNQSNLVNDFQCEAPQWCLLVEIRPSNYSYKYHKP